MTTLNQMCDEVLRKLSSYGLIQDRILTLSQAIDADDEMATLSSVTDLGMGIIEIGTELIHVQDVWPDFNQVSGLTRGFRSDAAAHDSGAIVFVNPTWPRVNVETALNDAIVSSYPQLFGVAEETFTVSAVENTYDLNALTEQVIKVTTNDPDPLDEPRVLTRWRVDGDLNRLIINDDPIPGQEIKVLARRRPVAITAADELTVSGLEQSAKPYVVARAIADLVVNMDASRLPASSAAADDMEANRSVGSATRIAQTHYALAAQELAAERSRLLSKYPPIITFTRGRYN